MTKEEITDSRFHALFSQFEELEKEDKKFFAMRDSFMSSFRSYVNTLPTEYQMQIESKLENANIDDGLREDICKIIKDILSDLPEDYKKVDTYN